MPPPNDRPPRPPAGPTPNALRSVSASATADQEPEPVVSLHGGFSVIRHERDGEASASGAEVREPPHGEPDADHYSLWLNDRRRHHAWWKSREEFAGILHAVVDGTRGALASWGRRMNVDSRYPARWMVQDVVDAPYAPDLLLLPPDVAVRLFRALIARVRNVGACAPAQLLDVAEDLVSKAATGLTRVRAALRDGRIDAAEEAEMHALADELEEIALRLRAVRRTS